MGFVPADENDVGEQLNPLEIVFELPSLYFAVSVKPEEFNVSPTKYDVSDGLLFTEIDAERHQSAVRQVSDVAFYRGKKHFFIISS